MRFELRRLTDYSDEAILNELRRVAALIKTTKLSVTEFRKHSRVSRATIRQHFGGWHQALGAAGLNERFDSSSQPISREDVLAEMQRVAALANNPTLTKSEFKKHSRLSHSPIDRHFGNWQNALETAGLAERFDSFSQRVSAEEVLAELQRVSRELDVQIISQDQFDSHARFTHDVVLRVFGTWRKAINVAGLRTTASGIRYTDDECFENLFQVWTHYGRAPYLREMNTLPSVVGPSAYVRRFGTWTKTLEAFIDRVTSDNASAEANPDEKPPTPVVASKTPIPEPEKRAARKAVIPECDKREIKLGLRYAVLKRDHFRCVICGRSPATDIGVVLHVDHVIAWSKGGKTVIENLRSTCEDCNLGKGSKQEDPELGDRKNDELRHEIAVGIDQADQGLTTPFNETNLERVKAAARL